MEFRLPESILKLIFKKLLLLCNLHSSNPELRLAFNPCPLPRSTNRSTLLLRRPLKPRLRRNLTPNLASSRR
jgi:hypothetical protein